MARIVSRPTSTCGAGTGSLRNSRWAMVRRHRQGL
jgi:hypothetical protein